MAALRAAGALIEGSGLDHAWVEADIFGPATMRQILECRNYKRVLIAHVITLQALFFLYEKAFFTNNKELSKELQALVLSINEACAEGCDVPDVHQTMAQAIASKMEKKMDEFNQSNSGKPMFKVFFDYIMLILEILNFIKATRQGNRDLHLASLDC